MVPCSMEYRLTDENATGTGGQSSIIAGSTNSRSNIENVQEAKAKTKKKGEKRDMLSVRHALYVAEEQFE